MRRPPPRFGELREQGRSLHPAPTPQARRYLANPGKAASGDSGGHDQPPTTSGKRAIGGGFVALLTIPKENAIVRTRALTMNAGAGLPRRKRVRTIVWSISTVVATALVPVGLPTSADADSAILEPKLQSAAEAEAQDLALIAQANGWTIEQAAASRRAGRRARAVHQGSR